MAYFKRDDRQNDRGSYGGRRDFGGGGDRGGRGGSRGDRRMYPAVCDQCGQECQVPFSPDGSKPVYCSNCFEKNRNGGQRRDSFGGGRNYDNKGAGQSQNQSRSQSYNLNGEVLASISSKLAQILELMRRNEKPRQKIETKKKKKTKVKKAKKTKKAKK